LDTATESKVEPAELQPFLPQGMKVVYPDETTPVVKISIHEVVKTLFEAIILVLLVMYLFLQNIRATLIPTIAVPVVLLVTFVVRVAFGLSFNTLTLLRRVLHRCFCFASPIWFVREVSRSRIGDSLFP
ncbi:efflux RND transporter permease subunit, partial [Salmonella enterica]|uniref:efflux RND transporter permease subunit n=1 Tax=Salmonella enterica TaxID=28901 RepID=UPI00398C81B0